MSSDIEVYCEGPALRPHERWIAARLGVIDDRLGRRWAVDDELSSGGQVKQYLHGDQWWKPDEPVDISIERHGPLRLRYSFVCERCSRKLVRDSKVVEPVLEKLAEHGVPDIPLRRLEQLCR